MDQNLSGSGASAWAVELNNMDGPVCLSPTLFDNLRVDNKLLNGIHAEVNSESRKLKFDSQYQSCISPEDHDFNDDVLKYINHILLEEDAEEKACMLQESAVHCPEDLDFNDNVLKYINHILLEGDVEEKSCMFQESGALQAAEESLYEVIGEQYTTSTYHPGPKSGQVSVNADEFILSAGHDHFGSEGIEALCSDTNSNVPSQSISQSSHSSPNSIGAGIDGTLDSPISSFDFHDICSGSQWVMQSKRGAEDGNCLPDRSNLTFDLTCVEQFLKECAEGPINSAVMVQRELANEEFSNVSRGKKNPHYDTLGLLDERDCKQMAVYSESTVSPDMFDKVLLIREEKDESAIRAAMKEGIKSILQNDQPKSPKSGRRSRKKRASKRNVVDMRTLLTLCAQAVAAEDQRSSNEFLKQIRQHATPTGDGMQRLAHYFADGLEARMAGAGTQIYKTLMNMPMNASEFLKAYHIYLATCPFRKISNFFSNKIILNVSEKVACLHIVDFGTLYGFQWPSFLEKLSSRPGGPPKVRFTAIDFPCPGFRPAQRIEETARRLAGYAEKFGVPFEFNSIAQQWETIKLEDIKINKEELLVVNCLYRFRYLLDETVMIECPRDTVMKLIRKMNPTVFVLGTLNGAYNAPFFITRFRETLFHYSTLFDALDTIIPRDSHERMLLEKVVLGREAMNAIACEAAERVERPETYRQWQVRIARAGFELLPLDKDIMNTAINRIKRCYHEDFVIDEDGRWLLQGGRGALLMHSLLGGLPVDDSLLLFSLPSTSNHVNVLFNLVSGIFSSCVV